MILESESIAIFVVESQSIISSTSLAFRLVAENASDDEGGEVSHTTPKVAADSDGSSRPDNTCQAEADGENGEEGVEDGVEEIDCSPVRRIV